MGFLSGLKDAMWASPEYQQAWIDKGQLLAPGAQLGPLSTALGSNVPGIVKYMLTGEAQPETVWNDYTPNQIQQFREAYADPSKIQKMSPEMYKLMTLSRQLTPALGQQGMLQALFPKFNLDFGNTPIQPKPATGANPMYPMNPQNPGMGFGMPPMGNPYAMGGGYGSPYGGGYTPMGGPMGNPYSYGGYSQQPQPQGGMMPPWASGGSQVPGMMPGWRPPGMAQPTQQTPPWGFGGGYGGSPGFGFGGMGGGYPGTKPTPTQQGGGFPGWGGLGSLFGGGGFPGWGGLGGMMGGGWGGFGMPNQGFGPAMMQGWRERGPMALGGSMRNQNQLARMSNR